MSEKIEVELDETAMTFLKKTMEFLKLDAQDCIRFSVVVTGIRTEELMKKDEEDV